MAMMIVAAIKAKISSAVHGVSPVIRVRAPGIRRQGARARIWFGHFMGFPFCKPGQARGA